MAVEKAKHLEDYDNAEIAVNENYDAVLTLEPTCPFRSTETIDKCIQLMASSESIDSVIANQGVERAQYIIERLIENNCLIKVFI